MFYTTTESKDKNGVKIKSDRAVEKYKMEHPNTKLTDKEIRDLLKYGE